MLLNINSIFYVLYIWARVAIQAQSIPDKTHLLSFFFCDPDTINTGQCVSAWLFMIK
jgi:hypothetical protein